MTKVTSNHSELELLRDQLRQMTNQLAVIHSVNDGLINNLSINEIYDKVGEYIQKVFATDSIFIMRFDLDNKKTFLRYMWEKGKKFEISEKPMTHLGDSPKIRSHSPFSNNLLLP